MQYENRFANWIIKVFGNWLLKEEPPYHTHLSNYGDVLKIIRSADVLLVEGRHRISAIIRHVTLSPWTHAALYIGTLQDIQDKELQEKIKQDYSYSATEPLVIESLLGQGTVVSPLSKYKQDHIRLCRPVGITNTDIKKVIAFALSRLGSSYSLRHVFDLARFLFPWKFYPTRWRSTLFQHNALKPTQEICSSLIAEAFQSVPFPILPVVICDTRGVEMVLRNPNLYTPSDFDFSPYFAIIKYPIFPSGSTSYRDLPWAKGMISDDVAIVPLPIADDDSLQEKDLKKK